jgi:lysine biosynthesis protein LysW
MVAECPDCETTIRFHRPLRVGQIVICPECEADLEVRQLNPLELYWAFEYEDEYDQYDDYDEYEDFDDDDDDWE